MPTLNFNDLMKHIQKQVNSTMVNEVSDVVSVTMSAETDSVVYDAYEPVKYGYDRRGDDGGLSDMSNIKTELVADGVIAVSNETPLAGGYPNSGSGKSLTEIIITGEGYDYTGYGYEYEQPRDFIETTKEDLRRTGIHKQALKEGLQKRGLTVK